MKIPIRDFINKEVMKAQADWSLDRLAGFLVDNCFSGAPVVDEDDKLIGVVSLTDIVRYDSLHMNNVPLESPPEYYTRELANQYAREEIKLLRIKAESPVTVREIMTPIVFEVSEDAAVQEVADTMIRGHIHRVFVTRDKKIVGIITTLDMLRILRDL